MKEAEERKEQLLDENKVTFSTFDQAPLPIFSIGTLISDFDIKRHHKSISIPDGCIVITGGLDESENGKKLFKKYFYWYKFNKTFKINIKT